MFFKCCFAVPLFLTGRGPTSDVCPSTGSLAFPLSSSMASRVLLSIITSINIAGTGGAILLTHPSWLWDLASPVWSIAKVFQLAGV